MLSLRVEEGADKKVSRPSPLRSASAIDRTQAVAGDLAGGTQAWASSMSSREESKR